jgi:uncharacterized membrane protein YfcA
MPSLEIWHVPVLVAGGFVCGVMNALAGGGSFVTLPLLLFIGLPPQVANATNRVAIVCQAAAGSVVYHRHRVMPWRHLPGLAVVMTLGAILGAYYASHLGESLFRKIAAVLFAAMLTTVFVDPERWARESSTPRVPPYLYPLLFLVGAYSGFLQAGVGTLTIGIFVLLGGYDVVRGNALKFALATLSTSAALIIFMRAGQVRWLPGAALAAGTIVGGVVGAKLVIAKGARWVRAFVAVAAVAAIVKLLAG